MREVAMPLRLHASSPSDPTGGPRHRLGYGYLRPEGTRVVNGWRFLTNHAYVLLAVARRPDVTVREIAEQVGITERAVSAIVRQLETNGYVSSKRMGRRKRY